MAFATHGNYIRKSDLGSAVKRIRLIKAFAQFTADSRLENVEGNFLRRLGYAQIYSNEL